MKARTLKFKDVKKGDWLIDEWSQVCKVVSKSEIGITTRRYENRAFWDGPGAVWTENSFNGRKWHKTRARKGKSTMKPKRKKLPSYTIKQAFEEVSPCELYTLARAKSWFPGKRRITARDVLKVPARKFRSMWDKTYAAMMLMPGDLARHVSDWICEDFDNRDGTAAEARTGLKLCDAYERGELEK